MWLIALIVVGGLLAVIAIYWRTRPSVESLTARYVRLAHRPPEQARESLQRQVERLKTRFPERSELWYLRRVIEDLLRERRR